MNEKLLVVPKDHLSGTFKGYCNNYQSLLLQVRFKPRRSAVHELRTTLRRILASLDLLCELLDRGLESQVFQRSLTQVRKALKEQLQVLSDLRDYQVEERALGNDFSASIESDFRTFIRKQRKKEQKKVKRFFRKTSLKKCKLKLQQAEHCFAGFQAKEKIESVLNREFELFKRDVLEANRTDLSSLHEARIQFKKYRYQWEFVEPVFPIPNETKEKLKLFQTLLGNTQDTVVMIRSLLRYLVREKESNPTSALLTLLRKEASQQEQLLAQFQEQKPQLVADIQPKSV